MIKNSVKILMLIFALCFNALATNDFIENGWKGIKPLETNKKTVEQVLGQPEKTDDNSFQFYSSDDEFVRINYSTAPCKQNYYGRGDYNVPEDTVLDYYVILTKRMKLKDFKFHHEKYKREEDSERLDLIYYKNSDDGIMITVGVKDGIEYVGEVRFYPTPKTIEKCECKNNKKDN